MRKIVMLIIIAAFAISGVSGCGSKKLGEREFGVIWQEYLRMEFEESFDEKQSVIQREKILSGLVSEYGFSLDEFKSYMKEKHLDKYNKIFVE